MNVYLFYRLCLTVILFFSVFRFSEEQEWCQCQQDDIKYIYQIYLINLNIIYLMLFCVHDALLT